MAHSLVLCPRSHSLVLCPLSPSPVLCPRSHSPVLCPRSHSPVPCPRGHLVGSRPAAASNRGANPLPNWAPCRLPPGRRGAARACPPVTSSVLPDGQHGRVQSPIALYPLGILLGIFGLLYRVYLGNFVFMCRLTRLEIELEKQYKLILTWTQVSQFEALPEAEPRTCEQTRMWAMGVLWISQWLYWQSSLPQRTPTGHVWWSHAVTRSLGARRRRPRSLSPAGWRPRGPQAIAELALSPRPGRPPSRRVPPRAGSAPGLSARRAPPPAALLCPPVLLAPHTARDVLTVRRPQSGEPRDEVETTNGETQT